MWLVHLTIGGRNAEGKFKHIAKHAAPLQHTAQSSMLICPISIVSVVSPSFGRLIGVNSH